LQTFQKTVDSYAYGEYAHASFRDVGDEQEIAEYLISKGLENVVVEKTLPTIEDCFIKLLKNRLR
jgi:hypothetical protein